LKGRFHIFGDTQYVFLKQLGSLYWGLSQDDGLPNLVEPKTACPTCHILIFGDGERSSIFANELVLCKHDGRRRRVDARCERCRGGQHMYAAIHDPVASFNGLPLCPQ
jgi:hypothetical protein